MPCTDEATCLQAIQILREKKITLNAAIAELERKLRHIRFLSQDISSEEFKHLQALPLSSRQHPVHKISVRKLPIRPSQQPIVA